MFNVATSIKGNILTITVDLAKSQGPSASGKTIIVASTGAGVKLENGMTLGLNIYTKPKAS